jgi:TetR/AcrR family transcriptional regulator, cholesterol catabolism regulator
MSDPTRESTNERLIRLAATEFWQRGYAATSTRELAELLGIQKASLYHHIRSKEDLLQEISVRSLDHIQRAVTEAMDAAAPGDRLRALVRAHIDTALGDRDMHAVMLTELRSMSEERRHRILELRRSYEQTLEDAIARAQTDGELRTDVSARWLTFSLLNLLNWTIFWYRPEGSLDVGEIGDRLYDMFVNGAASR